MPPKKGKSYGRPTKKEIEKAERELAELAKDDVPKEDMVGEDEERYGRYADAWND